MNALGFFLLLAFLSSASSTAFLRKSSLRSLPGYRAQRGSDMGGNHTEVTCQKYHNSTLIIQQSAKDTALALDILEELSTESVTCAGHCLSYVCHSADEIVYGGGCLKDFEESCKKRPNYLNVPKFVEKCEKLTDSFVAFNCETNNCNQISQQNEHLMKCLHNTLVENDGFVLGGNLFNLVPLSFRPKSIHPDEAAPSSLPPPASGDVKTTPVQPIVGINKTTTILPPTSTKSTDLTKGTNASATTSSPHETSQKADDKSTESATTTPEASPENNANGMNFGIITGLILLLLN